MEIEMWTDFMCPFCYIGKKNLDEAVKKLGHPVELIYHSFQTLPNCSKEGSSVYDIATSHGMSLQQAKMKNQFLQKSAEDIGLDFNMESVIMANTFDAHRLAMFAKEHGKSQEMVSRLFYANYTETKHLGDHSTLTSLAEEVGLDRNKVEIMLASDAFSKEVHSDIKEAAKFGIRSVPYFVINRKYTISGAQPVDVILSALQQIVEEEVSFTNVKTQNGMSCDDNECEVT